MLQDRVSSFAIVCSYIQYIRQQLSCLLPFANLSVCPQKHSIKLKVHKTICYLLTVTSPILSAYLFAYKKISLGDWSWKEEGEKKLLVDSDVANPNEKHLKNHAQRSLLFITLSKDCGCYIKKMNFFLGAIFTRKGSLHHNSENIYEKFSSTIQVHVLISYLSFVRILLLHVDNSLNV